MEEKNEFDPEEVRRAYRFFRHALGETVAHCQDMRGGGVVNRQVLRGEDAVVGWAASFNGMGNVFVGRNPLRGGAPIPVTFALDVDPTRPKGTAASGAMHDAARRCASRILGVLPGGWLLDTGNGFQIVYSWPEQAGVNNEEFAEKCRLVTYGLRHLIQPGDGCELDRVFDLPRLIKLPGTLSTKGERAEWRVARFVGPQPSDAQGIAVFRRIMATPLPVRKVVATTVARAFEEEVLVAAQALTRLHPQRKDDYDSWLRVGMALRHLGDTGLALWDSWSRGSPKYRTGDCTGKWGSFSSGTDISGGITIGSLVTWAREDGLGKATEAKAESPTLGAAAYIAALSERLRSGGAQNEFPTGIPELDRLGPLIVRAGVTTLGARTNVGKTALAVTLAAAYAKAGKRVTFFSTETSGAEVWDRLTNCLASKPLTDLAVEQRIEEAPQYVAGLPLEVCDSFQPDIAAVADVVEKTAPDVVFFDHIQHIGQGTEYRVQELSRFVKGFHDIGRHRNAAMVMSSQLNRIAERETPALHHLKECGALEEESRVVILLQKLGSDFSETAPVGFHVAKNKGPMGNGQLLIDRKLSQIRTMTGSLGGSHASNSSDGSKSADGNDGGGASGEDGSESGSSGESPL